MEHASDMKALDSILRTVHDIETFKELKPNSISVVLPVLENWLHEMEDARLAFVFLYESARQFPDIFTLEENANMIRKIIQAIELFDIEMVQKIDFDENCIKEIYQFLIHVTCL
jgi:hypothetical protein